MKYEVFPYDEDTVALLFNIVSASEQLRDLILELNERLLEHNPEDAITVGEMRKLLRLLNVDYPVCFASKSLDQPIDKDVLSQMFKLTSYEEFTAVINHLDVNSEQCEQILKQNLLKAGQIEKGKSTEYTPIPVSNKKFWGPEGAGIYADEDKVPRNV